MGDPADTPPTPAVNLTAAEAAKCVFRERVKLDKEGKPTNEIEQIPLRADDVLDHAVRDDQVIVVTVIGEKLVGALPKKAAK